MNLIVRITILFVFVSLVVFVIGGVISFNVMMREVNQEQRRFLVERLDRIYRMVERREPKDTIKWSKLLVVPLDEFREEQLVFSDTLVMHVQLQRQEPHLRLDAIKNVGKQSYMISLYDIVIEADDIKDGLQESLITMYLILLAAVLIIGFLASYFILRPFNKTLAVIREFSLTKPESIRFPASRVYEFKRLNQFLKEMTTKVRSDYQSLKEFSENASHELQTPIAVVQSKLELLMDAENLREEQVNQINAVHNAVRRLSRLSRSLALLTKIENQEFANVSEVSLSIVLKRMIDEFKELMDLKSIGSCLKLNHDVKVQADEVLIELLVSNLVNNAIRHNWENGTIFIELGEDYLHVENTGPDLNTNPEMLFQRFKKSNQSTQSLGLGLAIVKKVCDFYNYQISYEQLNEKHAIHISFY